MSGALWGAGDVLAQTVISRQDRLDLKRTAITSSFGFAFTGPTGHW